jgi:hypothetical protein
MKKFLSLILLASAAASMAFAPSSANARPRVICKRVWVHGHLVRRCRPAPPVRHRYHRPPPRRHAPYV